MDRRYRVLGFPLVAMLALSACTGGGTSAPPATGTTGAVATPQAIAAQSPAGEASTAPTAEPTTPSVATGPVDACALLTAEEIAALVPEATPSASSDETGPIPTYSCRWDAATSDGIIPAGLEVTVSPGFVSGSGATADFITTMLQAEGNDPENGGRVVDGLGDVGIVTSIVKFDAEAKFLRGDTLVVIALTAADAPTKQDAVVALAELLEARLP